MLVALVLLPKGVSPFSEGALFSAPSGEMSVANDRRKALAERYA